MSKVYVVSSSDGVPMVFSTANKAVIYAQIEFGAYLFDDVRFDDMDTGGGCRYPKKRI